MRIECTEKRLSTTDPETGRHYLLHEGDTITVPDGFGRSLCDRGWAKDTDGEYPTGTRTPGARELKVDKTTIKGAPNG